MPGLVDDYAAPLGPIGVAIALGFWLWAIAYLWVASAVVTAVLAERVIEREHARWRARRLTRGSDVEADVQHVAVEHDVVLALDAQRGRASWPPRASRTRPGRCQPITSARMKPRAMSEWILPAASTAVEPSRTVQARASMGPAVKNEISPSAR